MGKRIITESDVLAALESGSKSISAPPAECIVTPQALDKALELGVLIMDGVQRDSSASAPSSAGAASAPSAAPTREDAIIGEVLAMMRTRLPSNVAPEVLEKLVREVVRGKRAGSAQAEAPKAQPAALKELQGVCFIDNDRLLSGQDGPQPVPGQVIMAEAIGAAEQVKMSGGYMQWEKSSFSRTVECVEICVVIEGKLHLTVGGETLVGKPGDMIYLPKGAQVLYSAPDKVKLACVNCVA